MTINLDLLDEEAATQAIQTVGKLAEENSVTWALVGGLAMALYGSDRTTKDIDVIADKLLPLEKAGLLRQGGARYLIATTKKPVAVDWIIRHDEFEKLFQAALRDAVEINGIPILTSEWLVILKFIAGRFKDQEDAVFLLSRKGLVNRQKVKEHIVAIAGATAWGLARHGYQRWFDIADGRTHAEERDNAEGYIDS